MHHGCQPADGQDQSREQNPRLQLGDFEAITERLGDGSEHDYLFPDSGLAAAGLAAAGSVVAGLVVAGLVVAGLVAAGLVAVCLAAAGFGAPINSHVPPLASILVRADALKACALTDNFFFTSPLPRILTPPSLSLIHISEPTR